MKYISLYTEMYKEILFVLKFIWDLKINVPSFNVCVQSLYYGKFL